MSNPVCRNTCYFVKVDGARGARGKNGLASGPLADGSVEARHITNDPDEQAAIRTKLGIGEGGGGGEVSVADFYARDEDGVNTDTHMFQPVWRAFRLGHRTIRMVAGTGTGAGADAGKHMVTGLPFTSLKPGGDPDDPRDYDTSRGNLCLPMDGLPGAGEPMHGLRLVGDGRGQTVLKQFDNFAINLNVQSADPADNARDIYFGDFTIEGLGDPVATQTGHIFAISGATRMIWERVEFRDFNADAVCLWPSPNPDEETHNYSPTFRDCDFDGGNSANRNCISVEDAMYGLVDNCRFRNACTDSDAVSVAAIDFEPRDKPFYQCAHWTVQNCDFTDINRGGVAFYLNGPDYYTQPTTGFTLRDCRFVRCKRLWDSSGIPTAFFGNVPGRHAVTITGNYAEDCGDVRFLGMFGVEVHHNTFFRCDIFRFGDQVDKGNREVLVDDNIIVKAKSNTVVLHDDLTEGCSFSHNRLYDCGLQNVTNGPGYVLIARRGAVGMQFNGNRIFNPSGRLKAGFILTDTASYGPGAEKVDNALVSGTPYTISDTFTPVKVPSGLFATYTFGQPIGVGNQATVYFDIPLSGATPGQFFVAKHDQFEQSAGGEVVSRWSASCCRQLNVVRVVGTNGGAGLTIPQGDTLSIRELVL